MRAIHQTRTRLALAIALLTSCAAGSTSIEASWRAPTMRPGEVTKAVTMFASIDGALRRSSEDALARELDARGMTVAPAYSVLLPEVRDRDAVRSALIAAGFDGIITIRMVGKQNRDEYYPTFDLYWGEAWGPVFTETVVRVEISVYSLISNQLLWSALSRSIDPDGVGELIADVVEIIGHELDREGVIARAPLP